MTFLAESFKTMIAVIGSSLESLGQLNTYI